jgi:hypothetical protein
VRTFRYVALAAFAAALLATSALAAPKKSIRISGTYSGTASTKVDNGTATIAANGTGKSTTVGAGKIAGNGTGDSSQQPCVPFAGTGTLSGPGGVLTFKVPTGANGCGDEGGHVFAIKGIFQVTKATGKQLAKAKGSIRFSGTYNHDDGSFSIKLTGSLTK